MPNFRTFVIEGSRVTIGGKAEPQDFRRWRLLAWVPYLTGTEVAIHIALNLKRGAAETVTGYLSSSARSPGDTNEILRFSDRPLPLVIDGPTEYLAIPGDVRYVLSLQGVSELGVSEVVADFTVMSKDFTVLNLFLPLVAIAIAIGSLLVSIFT